MKTLAEVQTAAGTAKFDVDDVTGVGPELGDDDIDCELLLHRRVRCVAERGNEAPSVEQGVRRSDALLASSLKLGDSASDFSRQRQRQSQSGRRALIMLRWRSDVDTQLA